MKKHLFYSIIYVLIICTIGLVIAGEHPTISYQGVLEDESGRPVEDHAYIFTFSLYEDETGGGPIWTENQVLQVRDGIFNAELGSVEVLTVPFDRRYWLAIAIDGGDELSPRIPLSATPYAFHAYSVQDSSVTSMKIADGAVTTSKLADEAITQDKIHPDVSLPISGDAGGDLTGTFPDPAIGDGAVSTDKIADEAVTQNKIHPDVSLPISGDAGGDLTGTYPNPFIADSVITNEHVADDANISGSKINPNFGDRTVTGGIFSSVPVETATWNQLEFDNEASKIHFQRIHSLPPATFRTMTVDYVNRFVGIGTDSPAGLLHTRGENYKILFESTGNVDLAIGRSTMNHFANIQFADGIPSSSENVRWAIGLRGTGGTSNLHFFDEVNNRFMMTLTQSGHAGIGTADPSTPLQIVGNMIAGAENNESTGDNSMAFGGSPTGPNVASGNHSFVAGGVSNIASGVRSFAAGRRAHALHHGTFVWGDNSFADIESTDINQFIARAAGGFFLYTNASLTSGVTLSGGGSSWSSVSDRNVKENFREVDGRDILERLISIPIQTWNYIAQDPSVKHIGPMAQDFYAAFGLGEDDLRINTINADGVSFAAIQGLNKKLETEVERLESMLKGKKQLIIKLENRLARIEDILNTFTNTSANVQQEE